MLNVTDEAAKKIEEVLQLREDKKIVKGLRVGVRGGGCSGFSYFLKFESFKFFFSISLCFFLLTIYYPACFKLPAFVWEKFGVLLGKFISPIVLKLFSEY